MYITVTIQWKKQAYDIQADEHLPIDRAMTALNESFGLYAGRQNPGFYKLLQQNRVISVYDTFHGAGVRNGDILMAIE